LSGENIYIDPWKLKSKPKADLILISHSTATSVTGDIKKIKRGYRLSRAAISCRNFRRCASPEASEQ